MATRLERVSASKWGKDDATFQHIDIDLVGRSSITCLIIETSSEVAKAREGEDATFEQPIPPHSKKPQIYSASWRRQVDEMLPFIEP